MSNQPVNPVAKFNHAITCKDGEEAWRWAHRCQALSLDQALSLTLILGLTQDYRFRPAAERFMERYEAEANPTQEQAEAVRDHLDILARVCPVGLKYKANDELRALIERLKGTPQPFQ